MQSALAPYRLVCRGRDLGHGLIRRGRDLAWTIRRPEHASDKRFKGDVDVYRCPPRTWFAARRRRAGRCMPFPRSPPRWGRDGARFRARPRREPSERGARPTARGRRRDGGRAAAGGDENSYERAATSDVSRRLANSALPGSAEK